MSGTLMLNGTNYTATGNLMLGGGGSDANINIASEYDSTATYNYGAYCIKDGVLYRCITAISVAEAWDSTHWVAVKVTGEFRRVVELTSAQYTALSSAEKNNGTLYIITDEETTASDIPYSSGVSVADKLATIPSFTAHVDNITFTSAKTGYKDIAIPIGKIIPQGALLTADAGVPLVLSLQDLGNNSTRLRATSSTGTVYTSTVKLLYLTID